MTKQEAIHVMEKYTDDAIIPVVIEAHKMAIAALRREASWIPVSKRLPEEREYLGNSDTGRYMKRLEIAYMTDTIEYKIGYYDGYKWIDKKHNSISNVVAWKIHEPYIPDTKPDIPEQAAGHYMDRFMEAK